MRVSRELVHKDSEETMLVATVEEVRPDNYRARLRAVVEPIQTAAEGVGGRGRLHAVTSPTLLGLEVTRQLGLLMGHRAGGIPLDWAFLLNELSFQGSEPFARAIATRASEMTAAVHISNARVHAGRCDEMTAHAVFELDGEEVSTGSGSISHGVWTYRRRPRRRLSSSGERSGNSAWNVPYARKSPRRGDAPARSSRYAAAAARHAPALAPPSTTPSVDRAPTASTTANTSSRGIGNRTSGRRSRPARLGPWEPSSR